MSSKPIDLAPLLDEGGWTRLKLTVVLLAAFAVVLDGFDIQAMSFAAPDIVADWGIGRSALAPIFAFSFVGMAIGTFVGGWFGDRVGRRRAILLSITGFAATTGLIAFAPNLTVLGIVRFVSSIGLGAMIPNVTSIIAENTPSRHRAFAVAMGLVCNPVGGAIGGLVSAQILPLVGWRGLFLLAGLLPLLFVLLLYFMLPESLRYLRRSGRNQEKLEAGLRAYGVIVAPGQAIIDSAETSKLARASWKALFAGTLRRDTIGLSLGFVGAMMGIYGTFAWMPLLLAAGGFSVSQSSLGLALFNASGVVSTIAAGWLLTRFGSSRTTGAIAALGLITALTFSFVPLTVANTSLVWLAMVLLGIFVIATPACMFAMSAHVYPVQLRGTGVGFAAGTGRVGATVAALAGAPLVDHGSGAFLMMITGVMAIALIGVLVVRQHIPAAHRQFQGE